MDVLIRQIRTKYPERGKEDREGSSAAAARDRQLGPPQKTQSFKGEKKRSQSWLRRQFSRQLSHDYDTSVAGEYHHIAVAAAAFAVKSLEETRIRDEKKGRHGQDISITNVKSKEGDTSRVQEPRARSITFSDEFEKRIVDARDKMVQISSEISEKKPEKTGRLVPAPKKKLSFADAIASSPPQNATPLEKNTIGPLLPSIKNAPGFADKSSDGTPSKKPETPEPKPDFPLPKQSKLQTVDATRQSPTKPRLEDNTADAWEKAELDRIKEKYEKLNTTVLDWENKKKNKAKRKLQNIEAELDKRRAKALHHYRNELARIDDIAGGVRSKAIENRRNEELKVKEKANKIRLTGKVPEKCLCC